MTYQDQSNNQDFFLNTTVKQSKKRHIQKPLDIVKILLKERAMKQVDLAEKIGISRQGLHNYLRGFWQPPTQIKIKIAQALEVDSSVIWDSK